MFVAKRVCLLLVGAVGLLSGCRDEAPGHVAAVADVVVDADGDALPDRLGDLVTVAGRVSRLPEPAGPAGLDLTLEQGGQVLRLRISSHEPVPAVGDEVEARGVLMMEEEAVYLALRSYRVTAAADSAAAPADPPWVRPRPGVLWALHGGALMLAWLLGWGWARRRPRRRLEGQRFQALFEEAAAPMLLMDDELRILEANKAACALLEASFQQLHYTSLEEWLKTDAPAAWREQLRAGTAVSTEASLPRRKTDPLSVDVKLSRMDVGTRSCAFAVLHDLTAYKKQTRLLETFHRRLLAEIPIEVVVMSPQGEYVHMSPNALADEQLCEWLNGKTDVEYGQRLGLHPEVALRRRAFRKRAVSRRQVVSFEETLTLASGEERHFLRVYNPVSNPDGEVFAVVGYGIETTELKRYQAEAQEARAEAEKMMRLREAFLDNLSHELRTPLTGILGAAEILDAEVGGAAREFVEIITRNGQRLMDMLNSMLDLAGLQAGHPEMRPRVVNVVKEVDAVVGALAPLVREKGLFLRVNASQKEVLACLDQACLHRVLQNLVGNAIKFTRSGGILVEVEHAGEAVHIHVIDTGIGIQNDFIPQLFDAFNQEGVGVNRPFEGAGIGLTVTKRLVDLMHGSIVVDSEKGVGSMFTIAFPAALLPVKPHGRLPLVLVVDRSQEAQRFLEYMLEPYCQVAAASDVDEALQQLERRPVDVVLVDVGLPAAQAPAVLVDTLQAAAGPEPPLTVAIHEHQGPGALEQLAEAGFDAYVTKPLRRQELLDVLCTLLSVPARKKVEEVF